jgi:hypothetical protein
MCRLKFVFSGASSEKIAKIKRSSGALHSHSVQPLGHTAAGHSGCVAIDERQNQRCEGKVDRGEVGAVRQGL